MSLLSLCVPGAPPPIPASHARVALEKADAAQTQDDPERGQTDRDLGEQVAGLGAEGALAAHPAERAGQAAALPPLNQDQQDQETRP